jgi:hypothetical protein
LVLGTSETLSFADTDNFGELQPVIALNAAGGHYPGGSNGFAELALNDPFMAAPTALGAADQWCSVPRVARHRGRPEIGSCRRASVSS